MRESPHGFRQASAEKSPGSSRESIGSFALLENSLRLGYAMPKPRKSAFEEPYIEIIDRLIARRRELKMTQTGLAQAYGEDQSFISRVERRQRRIDVYEFVRFCRVLRVEPGVLLADIDPSGPV